MPEYIERETLLNELSEELEDESPLYTKEQNELINMGLKIAMKDVKYSHAADVVEVIYGKWIDKCVRDWHCSRCDYDIEKVRKVDGYCYDDLPNFCPNCGVKMVGKERMVTGND